MNKLQVIFFVIFNLKNMENMLNSKKAWKIDSTAVILDQDQKNLKSLFYTLNRFKWSKNHIKVQVLFL
jgi:hypothetical protein